MAIRFLLIFGGLLGVCQGVSAAVYNGDCGASGNNVTWSLDTETGVLTISGTGQMATWSNSSSVPWNSYRSAITSVVIGNNVTSVSDRAFYQCTQLTSVTLPPNITAIGNYTFYYCNKLSSIDIPNSVTSIGAYAFYQCYALESINLPSSLLTIGDNAFYSCSGLHSIVIPSSVTTIGNYAFRSCSNVTSITIAPSVSTIGNYAFNNNSRLTDIYVSWSSSADVPYWSSMTDAGSQSNVALHVPCGTGSFYLEKAYWKNYKLQSDCSSDPYTITVTSSNPAMGVVSIDDGTPGGSVSKTVNRDNSCIIKAELIDACHKFVQWNDGNTSNPRAVCPNTNTTYTATFAVDEASRSGTCGTNLTWSLSCDSVLTISGTGAMTNWSSASYPWSAVKEKIKHVIIEEGVTSIGNYAFYECFNLISVSNPSTLRSIGFRACYRCHKLEQFNFPDGLINIGTDAGGTTFYECKSLQAIYIPASVTFIGVDAFLRCSSALSIVVAPGNTVYDSRDNCNAIIEKATKTLWYGCRNSVIPDGVVKVNDWAFEYQHNLTSIRISSSVTSFGTSNKGGVFKECENLKDIYVEWTSNIPEWNNLTRWQEHANLNSTIRLHVPCGYKALYEGTTGWNNYQIIDDHLTGGICGAQGSNLTWALTCDSVLTISGTGEMKNYMISSDRPWYSERLSIKYVIIEEGVTSIGRYAFEDCKNLTSVSIPNSVTKMDYYVFSNCSTLTSVTIPEGVTRIKGNTFSNCIALTEVNLPTSCDSIGDYAFRNCTSLSSITIPDGVIFLSRYAFQGCTALTSITIPNSVSEMLESIFRNCSALTDIYVSWTENIPQWNSLTNKSPQSDITLHVPCGKTAIYQAASGWKNYTIIDDASNIISGICGAEGDNLTWSLNLCDGTLTISGTGAMADWSNPNDVPWAKDTLTITSVSLPDGLTTIGNNAFCKCANLTGISIPNTVTSIGEYAFDKCYSLETVSMSNSVTSIGDWAFGRCHALTSIEIPNGVTTIGRNVFSYCSALTSIDLPNGLTSIGDYAFYDCSALTGIEIPNTVTTMGRSVFSYCSTLTSIVIPNSVTSMGIYVFDGCTNLTNVTIGSGLTSIPDYTFYDCSALTGIEIPNTVTTIGRSIFTNCTALTSIVIPNSVTSMGIFVFDGCTSLTSVTIGSGLTSIPNYTFRNCTALTDLTVYWTSLSGVSVSGSAFNGITTSNVTLHVPCGTKSIYQAATGWKDFIIVEDVPNIKSGTYGPDNIEWSFNYCDSTLSITGNGELRCDNNTWGPNAGGINPNIVKRVFVGKGVTYLGIYTLSYMSNIEYIEVEDGHPTHRTGCNAIIRIGTEQEGDTLIFGCPHTVIPTTCTTIRGYAFWDDHLVTEMTIPSSVKQIANMQGSLWQGNNGQVFYTSNNAGEGLKDLYVEWTTLEDIPEVPNNRLGSMTNVRVHVPCGTTALYKKVTGWKNFKEYIEESTSFTVTVQTATGDTSQGSVSIIDD